ncbi:hypothetical protein AB4K20DRAFT_1984180 [Rhizopus microsporus]
MSGPSFDIVIPVSKKCNIVLCRRQSKSSIMTNHHRRQVSGKLIGTPAFSTLLSQLPLFYEAPSTTFISLITNTLSKILIASSIIKVANEQKEINISDVVVDLVETIQGNYDGKSLSMYKGNWKTLSSVSFEADKGYPNGKSRGRLFTQIGQVEYSSPILPPDRSFHKKVKQSYSPPGSERSQDKRQAPKQFPTRHGSRRGAGTLKGTLAVAVCFSNPHHRRKLPKETSKTEVGPSRLTSIVHSERQTFARGCDGKDECKPDWHQVTHQHYYSTGSQTQDNYCELLGGVYVLTKSRIDKVNKIHTKKKNRSKEIASHHSLISIQNKEWHTTVCITNKNNTSQACVYCFQKLQHPKQLIQKQGGTRYRNMTDTFVCYNPDCPTAKNGHGHPSAQDAIFWLQVKRVQLGCEYSKLKEIR